MGGSTDEAGLFEFDQLSDSAEATGNDPPDEPDPPDGSGGDENAPMERATDTDHSDESSNGAAAAGSEAGNSDPSDPPDGAGEASNEPTAVASTRSDDGDSGDDSSGDGSSDDDSSGSDPSDPPDPSDGSNGSSSRFYEFNPVEESQAAVEFAEKHSRAAAKSAYKHAAQSLLGRFVRKYTSPEVRKRLDEVFSRRMLGSVMVGGAFSKMIESALGVSLGAASVLRPLAWTGIFLFATVVFVWWDHLARRASETAEKATEAATEAAEKASQAAQRASETAEKAAAEATGEQSPPEQKTAEVVGAGVAQATRNREGGSSAATRAGGKRPTAVRSRTRTPERRPNKRFENEATERVPYDEVVGGEEKAASEPVFEGGGFKDPADAGDS